MSKRDRNWRAQLCEDPLLKRQNVNTSKSASSSTSGNNPSSPYSNQMPTENDNKDQDISKSTTWIKRDQEEPKMQQNDSQESVILLEKQQKQNVVEIVTIDSDDEIEDVTLSVTQSCKKDVALDGSQKEGVEKLDEIDDKQLKTENYSGNRNSINTCPVCNMTFDASYTLLQQSMHTNICLNDLEKVPLKRVNYICPICEMDFQCNEISMNVLTVRINHLKVCATENGIKTAADLRGRLRGLENDEAFEELLNAMMQDERESIPTVLLDVHSVLMETSVTSEQLFSASPSTSSSSAREDKSTPRAKCVPGAPSMIVDDFHFNKPIYLLTHFHSDHYHGISYGMNFGKIICTSITAKLLELQFKVQPDIIRVVDIGMPPFLIDGVEIQAIEANHCPGACMFLLYVRKTKKWHLHTGDFRFNPQRVSLELVRGISLETVFLDTTYCNPKYTLMPQEASIEDAAKELRKILQSKKNASKFCQYFQMTKPKELKILVLFGTYSIGKERFFFNVVNQCFPDTAKIYASKSKMKLLELCGPAFSERDRARLTSNKQDASIRIESIGNLKISSLQALLEAEKEYDKVVAFRPTGWSMKTKVTISPDQRVYVVSVPYSEHSSYDEIALFIGTLRELGHRPSYIPTVPGTNAQHVRDLLSQYAG